MKKKRFFLVSLLFAFASFFTVSLSGCSCGGIALGAPNNLAYDGTYITWDSVIGAEYYNVKINNGNEVRCNSTTYTFDSESQSFEVTVSAVAQNNSFSSSVSFKPLATITELTVNNDGSLSWPTVEGATAYQISINGEISPLNVASNSYDKLNVGNNKVKVKPIVAGDSTYFSKFSVEKNVQIYAAPSNIKYDNEFITWTGNASKYTVTIGSTITSVETNKMSYDAHNTDFIVDIMCEGNHTTTFDSKKVSAEYKYLGTVTESFIKEGSLVWNPVENATGYKIKINNIETTTLDKTTYDKLSAGTTYSVQLKPVNDGGNYFASWSAAKNVYILPSPTTHWNNDLELDGDANNNFTWDLVEGAYGYTIRFTKEGSAPEEMNYSQSQSFFQHAFADVGNYTIEIKANAEVASPDHFDSKYSEPMNVKRLSAPLALNDNFIVSDKNSLKKGFTVNYQLVSGASSYQLYKDGVLLDGKNSTTSSIVETSVVANDVITSTSIDYSIRSMGKYIPGSKSAVLPCLTSKALKFEIKVQSTPQNVVMQGFNLGWDTVLGNAGYGVNVGSSCYNATNNTYDLSIINAGEYRVDVCTQGNGGAVLPSNYSSPVNIKRLESPKNIKITSDANGTLQYDAVANAESYEVYLGLSAQELDKSEVSNMYAHITQEGTTLYMKTIANCYNAENTLYYMTSTASPTKTFIRLAAPVIPEGAISNSVEFKWNTPANINSTEYLPTYWLNVNNGSSINKTGSTATKLNIASLAAGSHSYQVKAIGNDEKYLDSEYSSLISFSKLETPELTIDKTKGCYTWAFVKDATSYYMEIDGIKVTDAFEVIGATYSYTPRFTTNNDHSVSLKAKGNGTLTIDSNAETYIQKTAILTVPVFNCSYSDTTYVTNGHITVNVTTASLNCKGYKYTISGVSEEKTELTYEKLISSTGTYNITMIALGGAFDDNDIYYLDSIPTETQTIIILSKPNLSSFALSVYGDISWKAVTSALGYDVQVSYNDGEYSSIQHINATSYELIGGTEYFKIYSTIKIKVRSSGNGTSIITSEWVEYSWTNSNPVNP